MLFARILDLDVLLSALPTLGQAPALAAEAKALDKFLEYGVLGAVVVVLLAAFVAYWRHSQSRITKLEERIAALEAERAATATAHGAAINTANMQAAAAMQGVRDAHARELAALSAQAVTAMQVVRDAHARDVAILQENRLKDGHELSERLLQFTERSVSVLSDTRNALDTQGEAFNELRAALRDPRKPR